MADRPRADARRELARLAAILMPVNSLLTLAIVTGGMCRAFSPGTFALGGKRI